MPQLSMDNAQATVISNEGAGSRYEALIRLAKLIRSHPEEKDLFQTCASELGQVVPSDGISMFDSSANWVHWHLREPYDIALEALRVERIPKEEMVVWWVYQNQKPLAIPSIDREKSFPLVVEQLANLVFRSLCAFPMSTAHRKLGSLLFVSHLEDAYSDEDQQFLSVVADQIAVAMDDARAQARLRLLLDINNRIVTKLELRDLLREIVASIRQLMHYDSVSVALPDPEDGELRRYAGDHAGHEEMSVGPASERDKTVFQMGEPLIAN